MAYPRVEWEYKAFDKKKVELQPYQYESVAGFDDLVRIKDTGDYCRWLNDKVFEILYTASDGSPPMDAENYTTLIDSVPFIGRRDDMVIVDDVETPHETPKDFTDWLKMDPSNRPQPVWGDSVYSDYVANLSKELRAYFEKQILYGTPKLEEEKPAAGLLGGYTLKEKEMEIGGNRCHLCGAEVLYVSDSSTYKKKNVVTEKHMVYQCGTQILETKKAKYIDASNPYVADNPLPDRHIHAECI